MVKIILPLIWSLLRFPLGGHADRLEWKCPLLRDKLAYYAAVLSVVVKNTSPVNKIIMIGYNLK